MQMLYTEELYGESSGRETSLSDRQKIDLLNSAKTAFEQINHIVGVKVVLEKLEQLEPDSVELFEQLQKQRAKVEEYRVRNGSF